MDIDSNYSLIFEENETISSIYPGDHSLLARVLHKIAP